MKKFTMYTRTNPPCPYCEGAKLLASTACLDYNTIDIGKDIQLDEFQEMFPEQRTVPLILVEEDGLLTQIGGYNELKQYLESQKSVEGLSL